MSQNTENEKNEKKGQQASGAKVQGAPQGQAKAKTEEKQPKAKKEPAAPKEPKPAKEKKEKPVRETPAHLSKINKVAAQLPELSEDANTVVTLAKNLCTADICSAVAHLQIEIRRRGITSTAQGAARGETLTVGTRVKVISCAHNSRLIGQTGTVTKVQRIRAYAKLDGKTYNEKEDGRTGDYFFHSDFKILGPVAAGQGTVSTESLKRLTQPAQGVDVNEILDNTEAQEATGT
jgi:hypothetical protein